FHCELPQGTNSLDVQLEFLSPVAESRSFTSRFTTASTPNITTINWESLLLYRKGASPGKLTYEATLKLPAGWKFGTALPVAEERGGEIHFKPVSLITLIDSPVVAGKYFRKLPLGNAGAAPH